MGSVSAVSTGGTIETNWGNAVSQFCGHDYVKNSNGSTFAATETGIQAAIDDLEGTYKAGYVWLPYKPSTSPITISSGIEIGRQTKLIGMGEDLTVLSASADVDAITVDDTNVRAQYLIKGMTIDMNQKAGDAIHADRAGYAGLNFSKIEDISIEDVATGQYGIYLKGWVHGSIRNIYAKAYGTAICVEYIDAFNYGNTLFENIGVQANDDNATGLQIIGGDLAQQRQALNLTLINKLYGWSNSSTGTIGVDLDYCMHLDIQGISLEQFAVGIDLNVCRNITLRPTYIMSTGAGSKGVYIHGVSGSIRSYGGYIQTVDLEWDDDGSWGPHNLLNGALISTPNLDTTLTDVVNTYDTAGNAL